MSETQNNDSDSDKKSWFSRLTDALAREPRDKEQVLEMLQEAEARNVLDHDALTMIEGVLQVSDMQVRDIMIPRPQMVVVEQNVAPEEFLPTLLESAHSRFPVIGENRDEVVGILLAKDLLHYFANKDKVTFNIRDVLRPAVFVPESKRLNVLLKEFRASRNHMAIVVDEYGGVAGLVTIEDVLEQIVGEIEDEHDVDEDIFIVRHGENKFTVKALTLIEDFNEYFGSEFSDEEFDTIGGLIMNQLGRLPKRSETVVIDRFEFRVLKADNRRIYSLQLTVLERVESSLKENSDSES